MSQKCIKSYLQKYDRQINKEKDSPSVSKEEEVFQNIVSEVNAALKRGEGFPLSEEAILPSKLEPKQQL